MPDYAGPLQRLVPSLTLWLVIAWPFAGVAWQVLVVRRRAERARTLHEARRALRWARNGGLWFLALAFATTVAHVVVLVGASRGGAGALFQPLARGARFGQLDAQIDLLFDPLSAAFCSLACAVAAGSAALLAARPSAGIGWRSWACLHLSLGGGLVAFVGDGFVATTVGWSLAGAAAAWLAGWTDGSAGVVAAMRSAVAIAATLVGAVLLFWGLGGSWDGDDYIPDAQARFVAVRVGGHPGRETADRPVAANGTSLTFTGVPGAVVFIDDARTTSMRSPFVGVPVRPGAHTLRIHTSDGASDQVLRRVAFDEDDEEVTLVALGPTLAFRGLADQLALRDRDDNAPPHPALELHGGPGGVAVVAAAILALLVGAGLMSGGPPPSGAPLALSALAQGATTVALGPFLIARVALLFPLAPSTWIAVESVGAAILFVAGWRAPTAPRVHRWLAFVGVAPAALGFLALGAIGVTAATVVIALAGMATAALYLTAGATDAGPGAADLVAPPGPIEDLLLLRAPVRLGTLFAGMDRWVVEATAAGVGGLVRAGAWGVAAADEGMVGAPANAVAASLQRAERGVEAALGVRLGRVAWALLASVAVAVVARALWLGAWPAR